ncbi:tannase/feruloyl esterase family alpha/beta hydrolase [Pseudorhodoferax sp. Leaf274]|uniref:tannase/feruloyl esterase family alpha/beta hydrolase n=1 Tax=Pseudorhodoferax sp. Leaf274 TaxID=1736318 RepID=UPI000702E7CF|nr:tannase/feruloyl esterase family alpha/beta hydrolase [Pseudorhodoferax sp. Leaf274]KQP45511.1 tannase [Pseudorhodoferax sp. Leaf274]
MQIALSASLIAVLACAGCGGSDDDAPKLTLAEQCPLLTGKTLSGGATVQEAKVVAATGAQPEACVVQARLDGSTLRLEARMPTSGWNGKIAFLGGGGFDGAMPVATDQQFSPSILSERYATLGTNGGYDYPGARGLDYFKATFALNPEQLADFTYRSEHRALPPGKALVASFFGTAASRSYFEGCSMGGHDALTLAQRYPEDFDGIVARAPAGNIMGLFMQFNRISKQVRTPANTLNEAKQTLLANAVLAQCDGLDGVADGIISKPEACHYDAAPLRCAAGADTGDTCLSDAQIATVNTVTSAIATADGAWSHPGYNPGAENAAKGWGEYIWPSAALGGTSVQGLFSDGFVRSFITQDASYDTLAWNYDDWLPRMGVVGGMFQAFDPNLAALNARGAKLILWNGTTDSSVSARDTARYYDKVVASLGQARADQTVELFMAPGVGHCFGGAGPDKVDLLKAVATWVEQGTPASAQALVHRKLDAGGATTVARPLCKYPAYPRYKGSGDVNDAASFACSTS